MRKNRMVLVALLTFLMIGDGYADTDMASDLAVAPARMTNEARLFFWRSTTGGIMQTEAGVHSVTSYLASMSLAVRDSTQIDTTNVVSGVTGMPERFSGQVEEMRASGRIASKLAAGTLSGIGFAIVGGFVFVTTEDCSG